MGEGQRRFQKMADVNRESPSPPPTLGMLFRNSQLEHSSSSSRIKRAGDRIFSEVTPSDITIVAGGDAFNLHKFPLVSKCGHLKKLFSEDKTVTSLRLSLEVPDASKAFQLVVNFCYGKDLPITIDNIAVLRCVSEELEMTDEYSPNNLVSVAEDYIKRVALTSLPNAITVLRCSESLGPIAERVKLVSRCINAIGYIASNQDHFYLALRNENHQGFVDCWAQELTVLGIDTLGRVLFAMKEGGFKQDALGTILLLYAQKSLKGLDIFGRGRKKMDSKRQYEKRVVLETIVGLLPKEARTTLPVTSLTMLLRAAIYLETAIACRLDLEKMISFRLDQATLDDLLIPSFSFAGDTLFDVDTVQRILVDFLESDVDVEVDVDVDPSNSTASNVEKKKKRKNKVGKLMEFYLAEISADPNLSVSKFVGFAELIPEEARATEDGMYRAIDIYLKAHPSLNDIEKKKVSGVMDCQRLSLKACTHAAHNQRLPVQTIVQVLYYEEKHLLLLEEEEEQEQEDQQQEHEQEQEQKEEGSQKVYRRRPSEELSLLRRQNSEMKVELMRMKLKLKEAGQTIVIPTDMASHNKPALSKKNLLKQLVRLNPFGARRTSDIRRPENSPPLPIIPARGKDRRNSIS